MLATFLFAPRFAFREPSIVPRYVFRDDWKDDYILSNHFQVVCADVFFSSSERNLRSGFGVDSKCSHSTDIHMSYKWGVNTLTPSLERLPTNVKENDILAAREPRRSLVPLPTDIWTMRVESICDLDDVECTCDQPPGCLRDFKGLLDSAPGLRRFVKKILRRHQGARNEHIPSKDDHNTPSTFTIAIFSRKWLLNFQRIMVVLHVPEMPRDIAGILEGLLQDLLDTLPVLTENGCLRTLKVASTMNRPAGFERFFNASTLRDECAMTKFEALQPILGRLASTIRSQEDRKTDVVWTRLNDQGKDSDEVNMGDDYDGDHDKFQSLFIAERRTSANLATLYEAAKSEFEAQPSSSGPPAQ